MSVNRKKQARKRKRARRRDRRRLLMARAQYTIDALVPRGSELRRRVEESIRQSFGSSMAGFAQPISAEKVKQAIEAVLNRIGVEHRVEADINEKKLSVNIGITTIHDATMIEVKV